MEGINLIVWEEGKWHFYSLAGFAKWAISVSIDFFSKPTIKNANILCSFEPEWCHIITSRQLKLVKTTNKMLNTLLRAVNIADSSLCFKKLFNTTRWSYPPIFLESLVLKHIASSVSSSVKSGE